MDKDEEVMLFLYKIISFIDQYKKINEVSVNQIFANDYIYNALKNSKFHTVKDNKDYINFDLELIHDNMIPLSDIKIGLNGKRYKSFQIVRV